MAGISEEMRKAWAAYECTPKKMKRIPFGPDVILVAPETSEAWQALEAVIKNFSYDIHIEDTDSYNCREIKGGGSRSLHSYGIALDINWNTNPYRDHEGKREPRFSSAATQSQRATDVKLGRADTDMTRDMVDAALGIRTNDGKQVFGWGGNWETLKDAMHFQIQVSPEELAAGIDWSTVAGVPAAGAGSMMRSERSEVENGSEEGPIMDLPKTFFDTVRNSVFGGSLSQSAVDNMARIVEYWLQKFPENPISQLAYVLATVRAEVGGNMRPVREGFAASDEQARAKLASKAYARPAGPFNQSYYGRGYVQLTHLGNYRKQSEKLGIDLVQFPDRALEVPIALQILVNGMMAGDFNGQGHGLAFYVNGDREDFAGARRTVNVQDRAEEIAGYARTFKTALQNAGISPKLVGIAGSPQTESFSEGRDGPGMADIPYISGGVTSVNDGAQNLADILRKLLTPQPIPTSITGPVVSPEVTAIAQKLGLDANSAAGAAALIAALEKAGLIQPAHGLTPVNSALGSTLGKMLDGKKTVLGLIGVVISIFLPQLAPLTTFLANVTPGATVAPGHVGVDTVQNILMPLSTILAGWGGLGKIDKWLHKPLGSRISDLIGK